MAPTDPNAPRPSPRDRPASSLLRRLDLALGQLNPLLLAVALGLVVLDLTCLAAFLLPTSRLTACVAITTPPAVGPAR
jgi:hypothetical protein